MAIHSNQLDSQGGKEGNILENKIETFKDKEVGMTVSKEIKFTCKSKSEFLSCYLKKLI